MIKNISVEKKGKINLLLFILKLKVIFQEKEYLINNLFIILKNNKLNFYNSFK